MAHPNPPGLRFSAGFRWPVGEADNPVNRGFYRVVAAAAAGAFTARLSPEAMARVILFRFGRKTGIMTGKSNGEKIMARFRLATMLALGGVAVQAPPASAAQIEPNVDSVERRQELRNMAFCLAELRPGWARRTLSQPYLSNTQANIAAEALAGTDGCIRSRNDTEVIFRTSSVVASLAEHYLRTHLPQANFRRVSLALLNLAPRNVSEDFALCVTSRSPSAARDLTLSEFGSPAEAEAAGRLAPFVEPCTNAGETLTVDLQALRALSAIALYRGVTTARPGSN